MKMAYLSKWQHAYSVHFTEMVKFVLVPIAKESGKLPGPFLQDL